jgi:hypothetical protein
MKKVRWRNIFVLMSVYGPWTQRVLTTNGKTLNNALTSEQVFRATCDKLSGVYAPMKRFIGSGAVGT